MRLPFLGVVVIVLSAFAGGCDNTTTGPDTPDLAAPNLNPEPHYTAGETNTVTWSTTAKDDGLEFIVEASDSPTFDAVFDDSGWTTAREYEFTGLAEAQSIYYRVRSRDGGGGGRLSPWSQAVSSIQDATPPRLEFEPITENQTSLRVRFTVTADDSVSGLAGVQLLAAPQESELAVYGDFVDGEITFVAPGGGPFHFAIVARDQVGNTVGDDPGSVMETVIPEPIILTDQIGDTWDITNAVLAHGMDRQGWAQGIGRNTIRPIVDPEHLSFGDQGYPDPDDVFISLAMITVDGGESLVMPLNPLYSHEVLDDHFNGEPIAVTF